MCIPAGIAFGYIYGGVVRLDDITYYVELKPPLLLFLHLLIFVILCFMAIAFFLLFLFVYYQVGSHLGWRYAFWGEAILMLPLVVFGFVVKPLQLKGWLSSAHFHSFIITLLGSNRFICQAYLPFIIIGFASSRPKVGETAEQVPVEGA